MTSATENEPVLPPPAPSKLKNMALFLASPFIGLVYAVLLPGKLFQLAMSERKAAQDGQSVVK
jgi:hypothetical protein